MPISNFQPRSFRKNSGKQSSIDPDSRSLKKGKVTACQTCKSLTACCKDKEAVWLRSFRDLNDRRKTATPEEYIRLRGITEEAWLNSDLARLKLEKHQRDH
jgi:hypothetical protein